MIDIADDGYFENPYVYEISSSCCLAISSVDIAYPEWELDMPSECVKPRDEKETPLQVIDDELSMKEMIDELKKESSIAVDLEHHDYRSYQGFTCLIQVLNVGS